MSAPERRPPDAPAEPDSKARLRLWLRLLRTTRTIEADLRENLRRDFATTLPRFDVMAALNRHRAGLKMSDLSGVLRVSNGNVTGIVDRLAQDGLAERVALAGDRRASVVRLTPRGLAEFARQAAAHETWIDRALGALDPGEAARMAGELARLADAQSRKDIPDA
ncbi:MAG: MarR family transcriptional regulator [Rhodobacteraceae bacterium]|nr:MarR family transcriptional regulator [Paracoccaceae bacterium]